MALTKFLKEDTYGRRVPEGKEHFPLGDLDRFRPNARFRACTGEVERHEGLEAPKKL